MAGRIVIGQYLPGDTALHRLDPRVKLALAAAFAFTLLALDSWRAAAVAALIVTYVVATARAPLGALLRGLKPVAWLMPFTIVANALSAGGDEVVFLGVDVSLAGGLTGLLLSVRVVLLILSTSLVSMTTSPVALSDGISSMIAPLRLVRVPVDDISMMLSIALRFIPVIAEEAELVVTAQQARGARFAQGGPVTRARAWVPVLVPLFVRMFRRADDLAWAMEARCYTGHGRTRLRVMRLRPADVVILVSGLVVMALFWMLSTRGVL